MINDFEMYYLQKTDYMRRCYTFHEVFAGVNHMSNHLVYSHHKRDKIKTSILNIWFQTKSW